MKPQEVQLVAQAKKGNREAFGELYDRYVSPIYRFVLLRVGNRADAEDLTQHIFLKAWKNIRRYKKRKGIPFSSWLYRIARNAVVDHYRTKREHIDIESAEVVDMVIDHLPLDKVEHKLRIREVYQAMHILTPTERDIILMRFVQEFSVSEVAVVLEKSEGTVRVMQHRGLKKLRENISNVPGH